MRLDRSKVDAPSRTAAPPLAGRRLVAIFAHPDDESFGPAATVARCVAGGAVAHLICGTRGEAGTIGHSARYDRRTLAVLRSGELERAAAVIGYRSLHILDYPDRGVADLPPGRGESEVEALLSHLEPDLVIAFHPLGISGHPDHRAMTRFATTAVERLRRRDGGRMALHGYTIPASVTRQVPSRRMPLVDDSEIAVEIDTSQFVGVKHRAIQCHRTQLPFYRWLMQLPTTRFDCELFTTRGIEGPVERRRTELFESEAGAIRAGAGDAPAP